MPELNRPDPATRDASGGANPPQSKLSRDPSVGTANFQYDNSPTLINPGHREPSAGDAPGGGSVDVDDFGSFAPSTASPGGVPLPAVVARALSGGGHTRAGGGQAPMGRPNLGNRQSTRKLSTVQFRTIAEDVSVDGSYFNVEDRTINVEEETHKEVSEFSVISKASRVSSLPMAAENRDFFEGEDGYRDVLQDLDEKIKKLEKDGRKDWAEARSELTMLGAFWRWFLRTFILWTNDAINRLRFTRGLQDWLPFQMIYESFLINGVIRGWDLDSRGKDKADLSRAFRNRNVSRAMVQNYNSTYDRVYHWCTAVRWNRWFDILSQFPFLGWLGFAASENFPSTKSFAIRAIVRGLGVEGLWITRALTGNLQGLTVHAGEETPAQNLAAESTDFEQLNRDQFGSHFGRIKTNEFRLEHRLPTDESIVRTFMSSPASTMANNGVEHVLRCLAKHWHNMLYQENGNFAHQRMEQLDPFIILRFHMPAVLVTMSNLRGRNTWDSQHLGPFIRELQEFNPAKAAKNYRPGDDDEEKNLGGNLSEEYKAIIGACGAARRLVKKLKAEIVYPVCAGIPSRLIPFRSWLEAIREALTELEEEAKQVSDLVQSVERGIRIGYSILKVINWSYESDAVLANAVVQHIQGTGKETKGVSKLCITRALAILAPKDYRTLYELIQQKMTKNTPCTLLLGRTVTLLKRELWRKEMDDRIKGLSRGSPVTPDSCVKNKWYWVGTTDPNTNEKSWRVCLFTQRSRVTKRMRFVDVDINFPVTYDHNKVELLTYIPVAEAISRAQKVFMTVELDHGRKFTYNCFMEFGDPASADSMRTRLRRLITVAQLQCYEMDSARLNTLTEMKKTAQSALSRPGQDKKPPQNVMVVGGGPTGLLMAVHCVQNVLMSGGQVRVYEDRDAYDKEAATYERAQIVRLDSRQMAMLRYHLGTSFEDIFIPLSGETDPHLGNTIPSQGFVEVTIKRLEFMLQEELLRLNSKDLLAFYTKSRIDIDVEKAWAYKAGKALKEDDQVFLEGHPGVWKVREFVFEEQLRKDDVQVGGAYDIRPRGDDKVRAFKLDEKDSELDHYHFVSQDPKIPDIAGCFRDLPPVYASGKGRIDPTTVIFESIARGGEVPQMEIMPYDDVAKKKLRLNVTDSHVIVAAGKPKDKNLSPKDLKRGMKYDMIAPEDGQPRRFLLEKVGDDHYTFVAQEAGISNIVGKYSSLPPIFSTKNTHFHITTDEPYAVCCIEGLKISMGMHLLGQQRWGPGVWDDVRSVNDQNTRIVGDFTKSVALVPTVDRMMEKLDKSKVWIAHFDHIADNFETGQQVQNVASRLKMMMGKMKAYGFKRVRLQTRFFELGMNYYLGMEFAREFDKLKNDAAKELVKDAREHAPQATKTAVARLRFSIMHAIDRLWYEACLEVIQEGDVYNPGGRANIPQLYTIDSPLEDNLGDLPVAEACVLARRPWVVTGADGASVMARLESGQKSFPLPVDTPVNELKRDTKTTLKSLKNNDRFIPLASFEILFRAGGYSIVRNTSGFIVKMPNDVKVHRLSDLSRGVDGYSESKVALAAFPVAHVVCNRAVKLNVKTPKALEGYMMAFVGDGQASPHFMRYSGLTGACINCMSFNNMIGQAVAGIDYKARVQRYGLETNWSNGEVVQRGTGANYGEDGFLRPGFTYTLLVDYLYQKAQEYHETGLIMEQNILSRDWKIKMAASLVPRGLENDSVYLSAMIGELRNVLKQKFEDGVKLEMNMNDMNETEMSRIDSDLDLYFEAFKGTSPALERYSSDTSMFIKFTTDALADAINYSLELRADNKRFTSEMFTQPKPVDSIVDDFAVEAQNFANSLTQSVAFAVAAAGLAVVDGAGAWASLVSGLFSIWFAFGTMTNVSRYKNRNEEHRRYYAEKKFLKVQKAVFSLLRRDQRESMMFEENPYAVDLDNLANEFIYKAGYYGYSDAVVQSFKDAYAEFKAAIHNDGAAAKFMRAVVGDFIPKTFHANSYLQEQLVMIYAATNEIRQGRTQGGQIQGGETGDVLDMLKTFKPKLEASLESQAISYGFFKRRKFSQWAVVVSIRYFLSFFFPCICGGVGYQTSRILNAMRKIRPDGSSNNYLFNRAIVDVRDLYRATTESEVASAVFLSGALVFFAVSIVTVFRIIALAYGDDVPEVVGYLETAAGWAVLLSFYGAFLALFHFLRKLRHLVGLHFSLGRNHGGQMSNEIFQVRWVTFVQFLLTLLRVGTVGSACVALPWGLIDREFIADTDDEQSDLPAYIAALSAILAIVSVFFFFLVEFWVRYGLDPAIGRRVFDLLKPKIEEIKTSLAPKTTQADIEPYQNLERETWEYTAREFLHEFRFDTVVAADRFGNILQYVQSQYLEDKKSA